MHENSSIENNNFQSGKGIACDLCTVTPEHVRTPPETETHHNMAKKEQVHTYRNENRSRRNSTNKKNSQQQGIRNIGYSHAEWTVSPSKITVNGNYTPKQKRRP
jgi:hypothetical protein